MKMAREGGRCFGGMVGSPSESTRGWGTIEASQEDIGGAQHGMVSALIVGASRLFAVVSIVGVATIRVGLTWCCTKSFQIQVVGVF